VPNPALTTQDLQRKTKEAHEASREVFLMRKKTEENARRAHKLLQENHLARRIRESYQ